MTFHDIKRKSKKGLQENNFNIIGNIFGTPTENIILNGESLKDYILERERKQRWLHPPLLFNIIPETVASV